MEKFNGSKYPNCESVATPEKTPRVDALSKNGAETLDLIPGLCTAKKTRVVPVVFLTGVRPLKNGAETRDLIPGLSTAKKTRVVPVVF